MTRGSPKRRAGALRPSNDGRSRDPLKGWARKDTALADPKSVDHPAVDVTGPDEQLVEVLQAPGDPKVAGVVDDGLDPKRPALLQVALHARVAEVGVERDLVAAAQQPGAVPADRLGAHPAGEDELHLLGTAEVEVVDEQRLEERAGEAGSVEDEGARHLDLAHRDLPPVAGGAVGVGQRQRQPRPPALAEDPDRAGAQPRADLLQ